MITYDNVTVMQAYEEIARLANFWSDPDIKVYLAKLYEAVKLQDEHMLVNIAFQKHIKETDGYKRNANAVKILKDKIELKQVLNEDGKVEYYVSVKYPHNDLTIDQYTALMNALEKIF